MPSGAAGTSLSWCQATDAPNPSSVWCRWLQSKVTAATNAGAPGSSAGGGGCAVAQLETGGGGPRRMQAGPATAATNSAPPTQTTTARRGFPNIRRMIHTGSRPAS